MVRVAPGTGAPLASRTVPLMLPVDWARAGRAQRTNAGTNRHGPVRSWNMMPPHALIRLHTRLVKHENFAPWFRSDGGSGGDGCRPRTPPRSRPGPGRRPGQRVRRCRRGSGRLRLLDRLSLAARRPPGRARRRLRAGQRPGQLGRTEPGDPDGLRRQGGLHPLVAALARAVEGAPPRGRTARAVPAAGVLWMAREQDPLT